MNTDMSLHGPADQLSRALSGRVLEAIAHARREVQRAEVLVAARRLLEEDDVLFTHCAWCGRYALGGHWLEAEERPHFLPPELEHATTHSICPTCTEDLKRRGLSR
jgi:hypothetical protein